MKKIFLFALLSLAHNTYAQKFEGLALTPPMGWNSWNKFQTNINEQMVMQIADAMESSGMKDAGYTYIVLDDGWMAMERDSITGDLIADPKKFPRGMKIVSDYVHSKGLKFGLYNCAGTKTCAGYPGTRGYEYQDARFYASQNIDYLKFDWCNADGINAKEAYATMSKAIKKAGRPIVFSLCEWGQNNQFEGMKNYGTWSANSAMKIVEMQDTLRKYAGPGHWNDPDMLEVGNGMTVNEDRAHFSMWAMLAAPLISGNDIRNMSKAVTEILTNKEVIAINQDALGIQGLKYAAKDSVETWFKPLQNGDWAVCFLNRKSTPQQINFTWADNIVDDKLSNRVLNAKTNTYKLRNLWAKKDVGDTKRLLSVTIPARDVVMLRLSK